MNNLEFSQWLRKQLIDKKFSQADLSRKSGISEAHISRAISGSSVGEEFCRAIARALGYPAETVFRAAGLLPPIPPEDAEWEIWRDKLSKLDPEVRARFRRQLEAELEYEEEQRKLREVAKRKK